MNRFVLSLAAGVLAACSMTLASCSDRKDDVKKFAIDFGDKVSQNNLDSVRLLYPDAEDADSLALDFYEGDITIENGDTENEYIVTYNEKASMVVKMYDDGKIKVKNSRGLFAYPQDDIAFAKAVGGIKGRMNDKEVAEVMGNMVGLKSKLFQQYVDSRKNALQVLPYVNSYCEGEYCEGYYPIKNNSAEPFEAGSYTVNIKEYVYSTDETFRKTRQGSSIPAYGTANFKVETCESDIKVTGVNIPTPPMSQFLKFYTPTGNEYKEYMANSSIGMGSVSGPGSGSGNNLGSGSRDGKLGDGPYHIVGKIGGKYGIHMTIDKGMKTGLYYYDKKGPANQLVLTVTDFNKKTGQITLEERDSKGMVTGTFVGVLSTTNFSGVMTVTSNGKTYNFDLKVQ